jgi:hypothetical protein
MTTKTSSEEAALQEALIGLEHTLLTPVIPGELDAWAEAAQKAAAALAEPLQRFMQSVLHPQYAEIARSDPEMLPRVEQLIATDQTLLEGYQVFLASMAALSRRAPAAKKDENMVSPLVAEIEREGTALIIGIRKQQAAASAWLDEALYRDRGPVD